MDLPVEIFGRLNVYRRDPPEWWDGAVANLGGNIFHTRIWGEYRRRLQGGELLYFALPGNDADPLALATGLYRQSHHPVLSRVLRSMEMPTHPLAREGEGELAAKVLADAEGYADRRGCRVMSLQSFMAGSSELDVRRLGYEGSERIEFVVDLRRDLDELWRAMKKDQRERVKRLRKEGIRIAEAAELDDLSSLHLVQEGVVERRKEQGRGFEAEEDRETYCALRDSIVGAGAGRLFLAHRKTETIGAILFLVFGGQAYSMFSGSTPDGYKLGVQSGLYWHAVETFKNEGFRCLNRGGVPGSAADPADPLHGIYRFKHRLGTVPVVCRSGEKVLSPLKQRVANLRQKVLRTVR